MNREDRELQKYDDAIREWHSHRLVLASVFWFVAGGTVVLLGLLFFVVGGK